jgi:flagellar biogenesis protein FliO
VDRETARRNMTAGMIAAGFSALVFALCFIVALLWIAH